MRTKPVLHILGAFLFIIGLLMAIPLACALHYGEGDGQAFLLSLLTTSGTGLLLYLLGKPRGGRALLGHREGFLIVTASWVLVSFFGGLPYLLHGTLPTLVDAYFETMSGFTTTGATVIGKIEGLPHGILLWRSMTQWLGGMGIIILSVAILPFLGIGGRQLFKAEVPGPVKDKLEPRIAETARTLWIIYIIITIVGFIFLLGGGMTLFDAVNHIFCAMATGGFSTKDSSIAWFESAYIEGVLVAFMVIAGMNFTLHYKLLTGDFRTFSRDSEARFFLGTIVLATLLVTLDLRFNILADLGRAFRLAIFQVVSVITTTGFVTDNFARWPALSQVILVSLMFIGGSAGSTGGAIKCVRIMLVLKQGYQELYRLIHPHAVTQVKLGHESVPQEVMKSVLGFFVLYLSVAVVATVALAALGLDMVTAFAAVATTLGNVGPGLGLFHPATTFAEAPLAGKWILSACMLIGRLEIYTVLVLLMPEFWKK